jgi:hypothetical protein
MVCDIVVQDGAVDDGVGKSSSFEPRQKLPSEMRPGQCLLRAPTAPCIVHHATHQTLELFGMLACV